MVEFRQDLLYRINTVEINLPPLRERQADFSLLVDHFLKVFCQKYGGTHKRMSSAALKKLEKYAWPGNVRELQHAIERAVIMSDEKVLQAGDFVLAQTDNDDDAVFFESYNLEDVEKTVIRKTLAKYGGNISQAARELGLTRTSLYRRLEKYGL